MYIYMYVYAQRAYAHLFTIHAFIFPVFEILLAFSENKDQKKSFYQVIPPRKVASSDDKDDETDTQVIADAIDEELDSEPTSPQSTSNQSHSASYDRSESEIAINPDCPVGIEEVDEESTVVGTSRDESALQCHESHDDGTSEVSTTVSQF